MNACVEDAFKAGFLTPFDLLAARPEVVEAVTKEMAKSLGEPYSEEDVRETLRSTFEVLFEGTSGDDPEVAAIVAFMTSRNLAENGYHRTQFTSGLVGEFIQSIKFTPCDQCPALSQVTLKDDALLKVAVLKHFTFQSLILSPDLKVISYRGRKLVSNLFEILSDSLNDGHELVPRDVRSMYDSATDSARRKRIVCDFIAGMTDAYAVEYYGRLTSETPPSVFKPLS